MTSIIAPSLQAGPARNRPAAAALEPGDGRRITAARLGVRSSIGYVFFGGFPAAQVSRSLV
jgi:hypothetical protein